LLENFIAKRNLIAKRYNEGFKNSDLVKPVECSARCRSAYYKYPLILDKKVNKTQLTKILFDDYKIETGNIFYPPCHMQGVYKKLGFRNYGSLEVAEQVLAQTITLPMHVGLTDVDVDHVIGKVLSSVEKLS
jgi:dTDP-4-amino-4,6-dideoxygalactose transaminase